MEDVMFLVLKLISKNGKNYVAALEGVRKLS